MEEKRKRNKEATKQKILDATRHLILKGGFKSVGINAVAKEAGVDKVMIYRYYGGLTGLLEAIAKEKDYWLDKFPIPLNFDQIDIVQMENLSAGLLTGLLKNLLNNKEMQELLLWELTDKNEISAKTTALREESGINIMKQFEDLLGAKNIDIPACTSVLVSGIYFLVLRSKTVDIYNSVPLNTPEGWKRIEDAVDFFSRCLFKELIARSNKFAGSNPEM